MTKSGSAYNELAKKLAEVLDPTAKVKMGAWVEGPDGKREVDVEVRTKDEVFLLIECKDWNKPVDIQEVDKLDSKSKDLAADRVILFSNSGFSRRALRKANRLGIKAASVLASSEALIKVTLVREFVAKALSVDSWTFALFPAKESDSAIQSEWDARELYYQDLPVQNWLHDLSMDLLRSYEGASKITITLAFKQETEFRLVGQMIKVRGFRLMLRCSRRWLCQQVREDVSLGYVDWVSRCVTVPNNEWWSIGAFDQTAWEQLPEHPDESEPELKPGEFRLDLTLMNPIVKRSNQGSPNIAEIVAEREVKVEGDKPDA